MIAFYDYSLMIQDLMDVTISGRLSLNDSIQILRSEHQLMKDYKPIIDWYYCDEQMKEIYAINSWDEKQDIKSKQKFTKQYEKDKSQLESVTILDCLIEMQKYNGYTFRVHP